MQNEVYASQLHTGCSTNDNLMFDSIAEIICTLSITRLVFLRGFVNEIPEYVTSLFPGD